MSARVIDPAIFNRPTHAQLATRRSVKWTLFPPDVVPAFVAELDVDLAEPIARVLQEAIARGDTGYANATEIADVYARFAHERFAWQIDPRTVSVVPDVMVGVIEALRVLVRPGDGVAINTPVYAPFYTSLREAGVRRVDVPLAVRANGMYDLDLDALEAAFASGVRAYLLCNPHNPVGRAFDRSTLDTVAELAARYDVVVLSDEIHAPLAYASAPHTAFVACANRYGARALALVSASKAWNLAGLKCALLVASDTGVARVLATMPKEVRYRVGHLGALAATSAFRDGGPWLDALRLHLDGNRRFLGELLAEALPAIVYHEPEATYLAWLDCRGLGLGDNPERAFLRDGRVALSAGTDFGEAGTGFVRLNFGTTHAMLREIVVRMARAVHVAGIDS